ncbi:MAG: SCO family protein [Pseudomonadota bacterium]|nr:SCO family protein [Pseudomonadota bacterium]
MKLGAAGLFLILILAAIAGVTTAHWPSARETALQQPGVVIFPQPLSVSPYHFVDQHGDTVTGEDLRGRNLMMFFGYTYCPDICPTTLMDLSRTWKQLPPALQEQWQVVLVSIDPQRDTPDVMAPYMGYFSKDFMALTGNPQSLQTLAAELNAIYQRVDRGEGNGYLMDHSANLAIISKHGEYRGYIEPPHNAARMVPLIEALTQE